MVNYVGQHLYVLLFWTGLYSWIFCKHINLWYKSMKQQPNPGVRRGEKAKHIKGKCSCSSFYINVIVKVEITHSNWTRKWRSVNATQSLKIIFCKTSACCINYVGTLLVLNNVCWNLCWQVADRMMECPFFDLQLEAICIPPPYYFFFPQREVSLTQLSINKALKGYFIQQFVKVTTMVSNTQLFSNSPKISMSLSY